MKPEAIAGRSAPCTMVPVRLGGAEVTEAFCTSAAGDYCGCARRGTGLVGSRFPERIAQITNAAEVLTFVVDRHPEPGLPPADIPSGLDKYGENRRGACDCLHFLVLQSVPKITRKSVSSCLGRQFRL